MNSHNFVIRGGKSRISESGFLLIFLFLPLQVCRCIWFGNRWRQNLPWWGAQGTQIRIQRPQRRRTQRLRQRFRIRTNISGITPIRSSKSTPSKYPSSHSYLFTPLLTTFRQHRFFQPVKGQEGQPGIRLHVWHHYRQRHRQSRQLGLPQEGLGQVYNRWMVYLSRSARCLYAGILWRVLRQVCLHPRHLSHQGRSRQKSPLLHLLCLQ